MQDRPSTPPAATETRDRLVVVTGMSGAGKSLALEALEDAGFETVDNLPVALLPTIVAATDSHPIAVGVDVRTRDFSAERLRDALDGVGRQLPIKPSLVFLDCDTDILVQRYTETRRPHPLAGDLPLADGIDMERRLLAPLRAGVDILIDTSRLAPADLKRMIQGHFATTLKRQMHVFLVSFGYRNGLPREADLVFDVRFLQNPHYVTDLRPLTGRDGPVGAFIAADPALTTFLARTQSLLEPLIPLYEREGKSYLTIGVGCTGGRHRSVYVVEQLRAWFAARGTPVDVRHRDLPKAAV
ncbi:MAG: RNase adapter RapZ [Rhodospirillaceae bacterium]|nr:RNase adapter RapZ [Rhodospirillaceae bacterium]